MTPLALVLALALSAQPAQRATPLDVGRWEREAHAVTIVRDDWGIAHVHGHTDADAVFGMEYAQAEDDFNRVETNYLVALGRLSEAEGERALYQDLRQRLFIDADTLQALYRTSPPWLQSLMDAFADGLNYYLYTHPDVTPRAITRFEPWMALSFTEGSIGGDIERVDVAALAAFYGARTDRVPSRRGDGDDLFREPDGSNGIAIAPALTRDHHALLWINPHTSFYFRSELQMSSDEGLDAYGAVTWGQFFVYQGFNATCGWMHTSSGVDNIDEFLETVTKRDDGYVFDDGGDVQPVRERDITLRVATPGGVESRTFTAYFTNGPVVRAQDGRWVSVRLMNRPVTALIQSYSRTRAADLDAFRKVMELHSNSSNNTVFADARGDIAYFHSNFIPRRDASFDWTKPVEARLPAAAYRGLLGVDESPNAVNPASGWVYNSNNWPWSAAGPSSPQRNAFPRYVETGTEESPRGLHALRLLTGAKDWTLERLTAAGFDSYLPTFARLVPTLLAAYDRSPADVRRARLAEPIAALRGWDFRWGAESVPTALAVFWGEAAVRGVAEAAKVAGVSAQTYLAERASDDVRLGALMAAVDTLDARHGTWRRPWGSINRFQRFNDDIVPRFDDAKPSLAVPFTSGIWGSLASFGARPYPDTKRWYGSSGNSFVAVVEFGDRVRARAVTAGGESGHPGTKHFDDQARRYLTGDLRDVYFYPDQLRGHTERTYHPGE